MEISHPYIIWNNIPKLLKIMTVFLSYVPKYMRCRQSGGYHSGGGGAQTRLLSGRI